MKRLIVAAMISALAAFYGPLIVGGSPGTFIMVRDSETNGPICNAYVGLGMNGYFVFEEYTGLNGIVDIDPVFDMFNAYNAIDLDYLVERGDYYTAQGHETFVREHVTDIYLDPKCGDGECSEEDGENLITCPKDCWSCGDGICTRPPENKRNCPNDCGGRPLQAVEYPFR
ncbi:MAG: hypothetical protein ABH954_00475 [Candidatus Omnitrophota bacterium]